jgi:hypothetical protein
MKTSSEPEVKSAGEALFKAASQRMQTFFVSNALKTGGMNEVLNRGSFSPEVIAAARARNKEPEMARKQAEAAKAGVQGQYTEAALTRDAGKRDESLKAVKEGLDLDNQRLKSEQTRLDLASKILGYDTASLITEKQSVQQKLQENDVTLKIAEIEKDKQNSLVGANLRIAEQAIARAEERKNSVTDAAKNETYVNNILEIQKRGLAVQGDLSRQSAIDLERLKLTNSIKESELSNLQAELGFKQQLGLIDERSANAQKAEYETRALKLKSTEEEARIQADIAVKQAALDAAKALTDATGGSTAAAEAENSAKIALDLSKQQLAALTQRTTLQQTQIDQAKTYNDELIKQKQTLADTNANTQALTTVFGELGQKIGEAAAAMAVFAKNSADRLAQEANAKPEQLDALKKKNTKDRLSDIATLANAQKKSFKEETVAYKAISAIEKSASLERLALSAKEAGLSKQGIQDAMANAAKWMETVKDGTFLQGIQDVLIQGAGDPYTAIPRMIAMAQFVSSLTGESVAAPPPIDQGTLAGTGQQVGADGQTIGVRVGGVLGDPKAEAKSITDSVDELSKVFFNNLGSTSSNLITHLKAIQDNTGNTAKALNASGVLSGGSNPFGVLTGSSKNLNTGIGFIDSLFGGSSTSVTGAGIKGGGTLAELASGSKGLSGYTNIHSESSGFLGLGSSSRNYTQLTKLGTAVDEAVKQVFVSFNDSIKEIGDAFGKTQPEIDAFIKKQKISIHVSTVGLTATEAKQKLIADLSVQQNAKILELIPFIDKYSNLGTEYLTVAAQLIKGSETITFGLKMVGASVDGLTGLSENAVIKQQQIIKNFGGSLDEFAGDIQKYYDALFSSSERSAMSTKVVQDSLRGLSISGITTNKQLKDLIATIPKTDKLYADLVKLVPAFTEATAAAKQLTNSYNDQEAAIYTLLGKPTKALEISRKKELDALEDVLKPRQIYINALTDEIAIRDKLKAAYTASNSALSNSIKTLQDYKTALTAGANSTLSPAEKYAQAKSIFMQTAAAATAAITANSSVTEIANRDAALAKIQSTGDALLGASREVNASNAQYAADFSSVTSTVDKTIGILTGQQTDQQKQLGFLDTIAAETTTTAELLAQYLSAQATTITAQSGAVAAGSQAAQITLPGHAQGGIAQGVSVVGERGPELVDFATPSRVYSNQASNDLFNTKELVAEIKALRNEVAQLRDDQNKQTGAIIDTTIQSNIQNAQAIATANQNVLNQQDWKTRSQVRVA